MPGVGAVDDGHVGGMAAVGIGSEMSCMAAVRVGHVAGVATILFGSVMSGVTAVGVLHMSRITAIHHHAGPAQLLLGDEFRGALVFVVLL